MLSVRDFIEFLGGAPDGSGQEQVRRWVAELRSRGLSKSRLRQHFAALRFLFERTLGSSVAVSFLAWPTEEPPPVLILSRAEVQRVILAVRDARYRVLFTLMYVTGLRLAEACRLEGHKSIRTTARYAHVSVSALTQLPSPMAWLAC